MFRFKNFVVQHSHSSMKVGTDGVLLGAWCDISQAKRVLDVGTGCGVVALMAAQRGDAMITAIDIDPGSVEDALANAAASPWSQRIEVMLCAMQQQQGIFDHIISNPPFFTASLLPPQPSRRDARHTTTLDFGELCRNANRLLGDDGRLTIILPRDRESDFTHQAQQVGLWPKRRLEVKPKPEKESRRVLVEYSRQKHTLDSQLIVIETNMRHQYSQEYINLTKDFYLGM